MNAKEQQERQAEKDRAQTQDYINSRIQAARGAPRDGQERQQKLSLDRERD